MNNQLECTKEAITTYTHHTKIQPRYSETDQMGVIYYGRYLDWFEVGRTEFFNALKLPYRKLESQGIFLPVLEVSCRYHQPAHYDETVVIKTSVERFSHGLIHFTYQVEENGTLLAHGMTKHMFMKSGKPLKLTPEKLVSIITNNPLVGEEKTTH
jgi:acyl-CoA thioester hydrolase